MIESNEDRGKSLKVSGNNLIKESVKLKKLETVELKKWMSEEKINGFIETYKKTSDFLKNEF